MKLFLLALCALLAQSRVSRYQIPQENWLQENLPEFGVEESSFVAGKEYRFVYDGQILTGVPSSSKQHSGSRIQAIVSAFFSSAQEAVLQISHIRMGKLNRQIPNPRAVLPFMAFQATPVAQELAQTLQLPLSFSYNQGLISNIRFSGEEQPWSANIKRGVLNLLQVNLGRKDQVEKEELLALNRRSSPVQGDAAYRVMESTLDGECETVYTVVNEPHPFYSGEQVLNVSKSIDFERCQKRPSIKYNFRFQAPCPSCDSPFNTDQKFLKSSSVFRYNITGTPEQFIIQEAAVESQYVFVPFNEQGNVIVTYVNQTLQLVKTNAAQQIPQVRQQQQSDSQMIYTPEWDVLKERFFMEGEEAFQANTPYPSIPKQIEFAASLFRQLVSNMGESVEEQAPRVFERLVIFFRTLKRQEIQKIWKRFFVEVPSDFTPEQHQKVKSLLVDAMAFAGTKDNVFFLTQKIKARQIPPFQAALAIKSFINIRVVSQEMIQELLTLGQSEVCQRNFFLKQSVYLTVGSMMNALCAPNEDQLALEFPVPAESRFCPREFKERFVENIVQKFQSAQNFQNKVVFLKCLSNAGLDLSVFPLEKIIRQTQNQFPSFLRAEAVLALRQLKDFMPRKVQNILLPIFMNRFEAPELRIVSAYMIFQTNPQRPVLDQMARRLFSDPSRQVQSFVYTYMYTMANSTNPCEKRVADDMALSLRHAPAPHFSFFLGYSKNVHKTFHSRKYKVGMDFDFVNIFSNTTYLPKHLAFSVSPVLGGFWSKFLTTFRFSSQGFENYFWKYFGQRGFFFEKPMEELLMRSPRSIQSRSPQQELKNMFESLRIRPREYFPERPQAIFSMAFKNQEFGFLPFSFDSLPEEFIQLLESGRLDMQRVEQFLEEGYSFQFFKAFFLHEMSFQIPTSIGFPLRLRVSVPTVGSLTGQIKASLTPNKRLHNIQLTVRNLKPSFASTWFTDVQIWNPVVNSGLKVIAGARFFYPFSAKAIVDLKQQPMLFQFNFQPPTRPVDVFTVETRPVTYIRQWPDTFKVFSQPEEVTVLGDDWTRINRFDKSFGEYLLGIKMRVQGFWHKTPVMKLADTPFCPLSGPNRMVFRTEPGYQQPKEFFFKLQGDLFQPFTGEFQPEFEEFEDFEESPEQFQPEFQQFRNFQPSQPSQHQIKFEVFTKDSGSPRKFILDSNIQCGKSWRYCKFNTQFQRSAIQKYAQNPFKFFLEAETLLPETPYSFSELVGKKAVAQVRAEWGQGRGSNKFVKANLVAERSEAQIQFERLSPEFQAFSQPREDAPNSFNSPVFQYQHIYKHAQLLQYKLDLQHSQVPVMVQNYINLMYRFLKNYFFYQTDVAQINVQNPQNRIRAVFSFDPISKQYFNVTVRTPRENAQFQDIPIRLPLAVSPLNVRHPFPAMSFFDSMEPFNRYPMCHASDNYIQTFDQVKYSVPFSTCWTVLAKDCDAEQDFGVYIQNISPESQQKKLKIITPYQRFLLVPQSEAYESVRIQFGSQQMSAEEFEPIMENGNVVARAHTLGKYLHFSLPQAGVEIYFDGYSVNIKTSHMYRGQVCGLCGNQDLESQDEFRMASNELTDDVREFYQSYVLQEDSCQAPQLQDVCDTPDCRIQPLAFPGECQLCKYVVGKAQGMSQDQIKNFVVKYCNKLHFSWLKNKCRSFMVPKVPQIYELIHLGNSPAEVCSTIGACSSALLNSRFEDDLDTFFPMDQRFPEPEFNQAVFPVRATQVIEQGFQYCFSQKAVPLCPNHAYGRAFEEERRVGYVCMDQSESDAQMFFQRAARRQIVPEIEEMEASFVETQAFPETCASLY